MAHRYIMFSQITEISLKKIVFTHSYGLIWILVCEQQKNFPRDFYRPNSGIENVCYERL